MAYVSFCMQVRFLNMHAQVIVVDVVKGSEASSLALQDSTQ